MNFTTLSTAWVFVIAHLYQESRNPTPGQNVEMVGVSRQHLGAIEVLHMIWVLSEGWFHGAQMPADQTATRRPMRCRYLAIVKTWLVKQELDKMKVRRMGWQAAIKPKSQP